METYPLIYLIQYNFINSFSSFWLWDLTCTYHMRLGVYEIHIT